MLKTLFLSKNQKLVKNWEVDHQEIGAYAGKIIESYDKGDVVAAKKYLVELNSLTVEHLMQEDIAFYNLLKNGNMDDDTTRQIKDFRETFKGTKNALMNFIAKYAADNTQLDDNFISAFKGLVAVVVKRIGYEENNLYSLLSESKV